MSRQKCTTRIGVHDIPVSSVCVKVNGQGAGGGEGMQQGL